MKLIGNLKNRVENANSKEEAKGIIEKAGMSLTEDELDMVTGGGSTHPGAILDLSMHGLNPKDEIFLEEWKIRTGDWRTM